MGKIAIVGCQQSGKTVFMASLADYFRAGQREGQSSWLIPENAEAHKFTEMRHYEMRVRHEWPDATWNAPTSLKWSLHLKNGDSTDVEMLEFGGEVFRAAFKDDGTEPQNREAAETLVSYLIDAKFVVVLVALRELFRQDDEHARYVDDDIESTWVTRGLIDFVRKNLPKDVGLLLALTQADLYRKELDELGGPSGVLKKKWPMIYALYPDLPVVAVASVSQTTADGRPAEGYTTDGVLPVMKAYSEFLYGDPSETIKELDCVAGELREMSQPLAPDLLEQKIRRHGALIGKLREKVTIVDALYDDVISRHVKLNAEAAALLTGLKAILSRDVETQQTESPWEDLAAHCPDFAEAVGVYQRAARQQYRQMLSDKAKAEREERERRAAEEIRMAEEAKRDEERRRKLELQEQEQRAEAEAARIREARAQTARRTLVVAAVAVLVLLGGAAWATKVYFDKRKEAARAERARIQMENAAKLAEVRKAEEERLKKEEERRAEEVRRQQLAEENRKKELELKKREAELKAQAEKQRIADEANERKRLELERKKAEEERALEAERRKRLAEENRQRQIEIEREAKLRQEEEARQRELAAAAERKRQEEAQAAAEKKKAEDAARKLAADKVAAAQTVRRLVEAINAGSVVRSDELLAEARARADLLGTGDRKLLDESALCVETLKNAESGNEDAQLKLARMFYDGGSVVVRDRAEAYRRYLKVADAGDPLAQHKVGEMLVMGDGTVENLVAAFQYLLKAARQDHTRAQFLVAEMYRLGKGVEKDPKRANEWYERAARRGDGDAQLAWSKRLQKGEGMFFSDEDQAFEWLKKAALSGNAEACYRIGCQYYSGRERLRYSLANAYRYFMKAKQGGYLSKDLDRKIKACRMNGVGE